MSTYTRIRLEVEIQGSSYGPEWTVAAIIKQAKSEGPQALRSMLERNDLGTRVRVIGDPVVYTFLDVSDDK